MKQIQPLSRCTLRPMVMHDLDDVLAWRNSESVRKNMYTDHVIGAEEHMAWWARCQSESGRRNLIAEIDGVAVGFVSFTRVLGEGATATWAFFSRPEAGRGTGTAMELAALEYAFSTLGVGKLECEVLGFNESVVRLHLRHGFQVEGRSKRSYVRGDQRFDIVRLGMDKLDWLRYVRPHFELLNGERDSEIGEVVSRDVTVDVSIVKHFAAAVGDVNPVHFDSTAALSAGFEGTIAHGMLLASLCSRLFAEVRPGPGTLYLSQEVQFSKPVPVGATVSVRATVLARIGRRYTFKTDVFLANDLVCSGAAIVLGPRPMDVTLPVSC